MATILCHYPSKGRPELLKRTFESWASQASGLHKIIFNFVFDEDDSSYNGLNLQVGGHLEVRYNRTDKKGKVAAINACIPTDPWDILVLISDDMVCTKPCWDLYVVRDLEDSGKNKVWYKDQCQINLCTFEVMTRTYYDLYGYIYHPAYKSLFCDNEAMLVAQQNDELYCPDHTIVKHEWVGRTCRDELHKHNESFWNEDEATFKARQANGFK